MNNIEKSLRVILTPKLRWFLVAEFLAGLADMGGLYMPLFMVELGASVVDIGMLYSVTEIVPLSLNILGGWIGDSIGRLRAILLGNIFGIFSFVVMLLADRWEWMFLVLALGGISGSISGPSISAFIAYETPEDHRAKVYAVEQNVGNIVNLIRYPLAGLLVGRFGFKLMILIAGIFYLLCTIVNAGLERTHRSSSKSENEPLSWQSLKLSLSTMIALIMAGGLFTWMFVIDHANDIFVQLSQSYQIIYIEEVIGVSVEQIGFLPVAGSILSLIISVPMARWVDKRGENLGIGIAYFFLATYFIVLITAKSFYVLLLGVIPHSVARAAAGPAYLSLVSKAVPEERRGVAFGLTWTSRGLIALPSPWLGGILWDRNSPRTPFLITICGFLGLIPLAWLKLKPPIEEKQTPTPTT
jgi:MFS family permease